MSKRKESDNCTVGAETKRISFSLASCQKILESNEDVADIIYTFLLINAFEYVAAFEQ